jgi:4-amino-4-deoxy-L-arabinose transferase-like glycosyltransferase
MKPNRSFTPAARRFGFATLLPIILLAFALRTAGLAGPPLSGDEAFSVLLTDRGWAGMLTAMRTTEPNPPLHFFVLRAWMAVAGRGEFSVRFLSVMAGVLTVSLTYVLGRRLLGRWIGLTAALLAAVNPYLVWYSHFARPYSLYLTLTLASLVLGLDFALRTAYCVSRATDPQRRWRGHGYLVHWLAYVGMTVLALYTHYFAFFFLIAQNLIFLLILWRNRATQYAIRNTHSWLAAQATVTLLIAPWLLLAGPMLLTHKKPWLTYTSPAAGLWRALRTFSLGVDVQGAPVMPMALLFALVLAVGAVTIWRWRSPALLILGTYLTAPLAIALLGSLIRPIFLERYLIGVVPAFLVLVAAGVVGIPYCVLRRSEIGITQYAMRNTQYASRFTPWPVASLVVLIVLVASAAIAPPFGANIFDWRGVARALEDRVASNDVVVQNYPDPAFAYYYRAPAERTTLPARVPVPREVTAEALRTLLRDHDRLWLLPNRNPAWDAHGFVQAWLDRRAELVGDEWVAGHRLLTYRALPESAPDIEHRLDWRLGDVARLVGYRLDAERLAPGESFKLTLFWEPLRATDVAYTVFVHLWDGQTIWGQKDGQPQACPEPCRRGGMWPTTDWYPGDLIIDTRQVPVKPKTPPGKYQLIAGLYRLETGERLPAYGADGRLRGDYVSVTEVSVLEKSSGSHPPAGFQARQHGPRRLLIGSRGGLQCAALSLRKGWPNPQR